MPLFNPEERIIAEGISRLVYCNPFVPERIEIERKVLGLDFVEADLVWNVFNDPEGGRDNLKLLREKSESLAATLRQRLLDKTTATEKERLLYEDLVLYLLYYRNHEPLREATLGDKGHKARLDFAGLYQSLLDDLKHFFALPGVNPPRHSPHQLFSGFFQIRRAFLSIFDNIVGRSMAVARLRAAVWESIFTHDMQRYQRVLFDRMGDFTTLIGGESGTGKELVAQAIAFSRFIPFDPKKSAFTEDFTTLFAGLNLSALSPTLIESELFGHRRGAFTGALEDRAGWLETCKPLGTVFLDEIGELDPLIQVKLLRVLQTRAFQRLGDNQPRHFSGKIMAATNRDLAEEMSAGAFRKDFYYRLCSDIITTPPLREQLKQAPEDLRQMILFIVKRIAGEEAEPLADEIAKWIDKNLGQSYSWPGNFRELEQCVRNWMIRREYNPTRPAAKSDSEALTTAITNGSLTADELLKRYCRIVYAQTKSYEETARRLSLDRRTVKAKVTDEPSTSTSLTDF